jgi:hypothetical protein
MKFRLYFLLVVALTGGLAIAGLVFTSGAAAAQAASPSDAAFARCTDILPIVKDYGAITRVVEGDSATIADIIGWQESSARGGFASPLRGTNPTQSATVCLYQGQFAIPVAPPRPGESPQPYPDTIRLIVFGDGQIVLDSAGPLSQMQPLTPAEWKANAAYK